MSQSLPLELATPNPLRLRRPERARVLELPPIPGRVWTDARARPSSRDDASYANVSRPRRPDDSPSAATGGRHRAPTRPLSSPRL
jgi:hypothetical protein